MKKTSVLIPILLSCLVSLSQNIKTFSPIYVTSCFNCFYQTDPSINSISVYPEWLYTKPSFVKTVGVKRDSVFIHEKKENSPDSTLIMVQYFDEWGNPTKRAEYSVKAKGRIWRITNLTYQDDKLIKEEIITKNEDQKSDINEYEKIINTYEYDNAGNNIMVKHYDIPSDSLKKTHLIITEHEFDASGHILRTYTKSGTNSFLSRKYVYDKDTLTEVWGYDSKNRVLFKNLIHYDREHNATRIYLTEALPLNIMQEYFFDNENKLKQYISYSGSNMILSSQTYSYAPNGLIGKQNLIYVNNNFYYYYKHHYSGQ